MHAARLMRRYHDATVGYAPPDGAVWQLQATPGPHEVICHNDFAPYNLVFTNWRPHAIIDFDTAGPGPRIWDVSYAAYRFVPLQQRALALPRPDCACGHEPAAARVLRYLRPHSQTEEGVARDRRDQAEGVM